MGATTHVPMVLNPSLGASLLVLTLLQAPGGQALEPLETKWRESIEADLRNGDPTGQVCTKLGLRHRPTRLPAGCRRRKGAATPTPHPGLPAAFRPRRQDHRRRAPAKDFHRGMRDEL